MNLLDHAEGIQYAYGLFETLKVLDGKIINVEDHYERLSHSLTYLEMQSISLDDFQGEILKHYNLHLDPVVKVTCLKEDNHTKLIVTSRKNPYKKEDYDLAYQVMKSDYPRQSKNILLQHKTTNYLSNILEKKAIKAQGYDEAIHYNEKDQITEGIFSNVFFVKNNCVYTPEIDCGLLAGIQRKNILKTLNKLGICYEIGYYKEEDLYSAEEVFFSNAVIGIMPVRKYRNHHYDLNTNHITKLILKEYENGLL